MQKFKNYLAIYFTICCISFTSGCSFQNNFEKFYQDRQDKYDITRAEYCYDKNPIVVKTNQITEKEILSFVQKGYIPMGESSFYMSGHEKAQNLNNFAKKIGACAVLISERIAGTNQEVMPIFTPFGTVYSNQNVDRTEYLSLYFIRYTNYNSGIIVKNLTDDLRKQYSRNNGVYVVCVVDNSAGYNENVIVGDIIDSINGYVINNVEDYDKCRLNDGINEFVIIRDGKKIIKKINIQKKNKTTE